VSALTSALDEMAGRDHDPAELAPQHVDLGKNEIEQAIALMDSMSTDDISGYRDDYQDALAQVRSGREASPGGPASVRSRRRSWT
jgi:DNA end-binding protein Ku